MPNEFSPSDRPSPAGHPISVVARLTGVPIETLRVWERRYGFPKPARADDSNRRLFSDSDVERLRWVAAALRSGYRAGDIVPKSQAELEALVGPSPSVAGLGSTSKDAYPVDDWIELLARDDIGAIERGLRQAGALLGPARFVTEVAHPLAVEVGRAWERGKIGVRHEHVLSECLGTQLRNMLSSLSDVEGRPVVVLATLPGEPHALGLSMIALYATAHGAKARIVGANTPASELVDAAKAYRADAVGITITETSDLAFARAAVAELVRRLPRSVRVWLGGGAAKSVGVESDTVQIIETWADLDAELARSQR